jgi:hypothetical protein
MSPSDPWLGDDLDLVGDAVFESRRKLSAEASAKGPEGLMSIVHFARYLAEGEELGSNIL